jgi:serine/threonine-protein kinase
MVHRDIKPSNLFVCRQGLDADFIKVLDFGIVRARTDAATLDSRTDRLEGTPGYLAPEAAAGAAPDPRSDLYALGCVAYWLLTGHPVFEAETVAQALERHRTAAPEAPSRRTASIVPAALDALVLACLEKDPARRPTDAAELARCLAGIPLAPWDQLQAQGWWDAHAPGGVLPNGLGDPSARVAPRGPDSRLPE